MECHNGYQLGMPPSIRALTIPSCAKHRPLFVAMIGFSQLFVKNVLRGYACSSLCTHVASQVLAWLIV